MKVRDLMTSSPITVAADATVEEAAAKMRQHDLGALPVLGGGSPFGIVTDRDIAIRVVAAGRGSATQVGEICTLAAITVQPDTDLDQAVSLMKEHQIRRLPVVQRDAIQGIISLADIALAHRPLAAEALAAVSQPPASIGTRSRESVR